ncbi:hypothetical protein BSZ40_09920 [Buchananella hordeovulneris]|uniref:Uncharacterized protein n=1 Tax=Buchananella hordeovulneris TaxID=52770 RepID=A0A1Q5PTM3_9ACTO|nr:hypothetical protein BSZ40_09920 [Buchananella hordeovulneris]
MVHSMVVHPRLPILTRDFIDFLSAQQQNEEASWGVSGSSRIWSSLSVTLPVRLAWRWLQ